MDKPRLGIGMPGTGHQPTDKGRRLTVPAILNVRTGKQLDVIAVKLLARNDAVQDTSMVPQSVKICYNS